MLEAFFNCTRMRMAHGGWPFEYFEKESIEIFKKERFQKKIIIK